MKGRVSVAFVTFVAVWLGLANPATSTRWKRADPRSRPASDQPHQQHRSDSTPERPLNPSNYGHSPYFHYDAYTNPYTHDVHHYPHYPQYPQPNPAYPYMPPYPQDTRHYPPPITFNPPFIHEPFPTNSGYQPPETLENGCEWKMVFKAVAGNDRDVYADYTGPGNINKHAASAKDLTSPLIFRDADILDRWDHLIISKVKLEVFVGLVRGVWFIFDGIGSQFTTWFEPERLIASPYHDIKAGDFDIFSLEGDSGMERRFLMTRNDDTCSSDCLYLAVVDSQSSPSCPWEQVSALPIFAYGTLTDECSHFQSSGEVQYADRLIISVKVCDANV